MSNIILCGFKSSGKSTLARTIAERTGLHYIDTDDLLDSEARDLYLQEGPLAFRAKEKQVIAALLDFQRCIIATGGGTVINPDNVAILKKLGRIIYLHVDKKELKQRLLGGPLPAILDPAHPEESFEKMYQERLPIYTSIADYIITHQDQIWPLLF